MTKRTSHASGIGSGDAGDGDGDIRYPEHLHQTTVINIKPINVLVVVAGNTISSQHQISSLYPTASLKPETLRVLLMI